MTEVDWGFYLDRVLQIAIQVLLPIALAAAVKWINTKSAEAKISKDAATYKMVSGLVYQLVLAAEQNGMIGALKNDGLAKKQFVIGRLEEELVKLGIKMDLDTLDSMIEAAVHEAFGKIDYKWLLDEEEKPVE
jgi:hypothetical protein